MAIQIRWNGHACFTLAFGAYQIVLDPYDERVPGYAPLALTAQEVFCSHGHGDHNHTEAVTLLPKGARPFGMEEYVVPHDEQGGNLRGMCTVRIFDYEGIRVAHLADLGCMPEQTVLDALQELDAVMVPVGGYYTIDASGAKAVIDRIRPRVVIPMHYRKDGLGYDVIATPDEFIGLFDNVRLYEGNEIVVDRDTPAQVALLRYQASAK